MWRYGTLGGMSLWSLLVVAGAVDAETAKKPVTRAVENTLRAASGGGPQIAFGDVEDEEAAREILRTEAPNTDLVIAVGEQAAAMAGQAVQTRPILFCGVINPHRSQLFSALNIAGVSYEVAPRQQLQAVRDLLLGRTRVGILYNPIESSWTISEAKRVESRLGLRIVAEAIGRPEDVGFAYRRLRHEIDLLWLIPDSTVMSAPALDYLLRSAMEDRLPVVAFAESFVRRGALLAVHSTPQAIGGQCAELAIGILRGELLPQGIGIRTPEKFQATVNETVAEWFDMDLRPRLSRGGN